MVNYRTTAPAPHTNNSEKLASNNLEQWDSGETFAKDCSHKRIYEQKKNIVLLSAPLSGNLFQAMNPLASYIIF